MTFFPCPMSPRVFTVEKVHALVDKLKEYGIELREKHNLERLMR